MAENNTNNSGIEYTIVRRKIRYPRLEFKTGNLLLVLPENQKNPKEMIEKHCSWINTKNNLIQKALKDSKKKKLSSRTDEDFKQLVKSTTYKFSEEGKFPVNKIYFRRMKSKWGSCSSKKNLTLNTLMKYLPKKIIEYIIYHELLHLKEKRHSQFFWKAISKKFPDYERKEKDLFIYWFQIQETIY